MSRPNKSQFSRIFTEAQEEQFLRNGFVKLERAFPKKVAEEACAILWRESGYDPGKPVTWTHPVVRIGDCAQPPFREAANTPALRAAFDQLVGAGRWIPRESLGGFPIRFPHPDDPGDTGWHVDASFPPEHQAGSYFDWRINIESKGRALLMLFLFSDVTELDAPTRIRVGSHLRVARLLASKGPEGMSFVQVADALEGTTGDLPESTATGPIGTVYLCHPFLAHAAQRHRGNTPRFMAQPPLYQRDRFNLARSDEDYSLVERAIRLGLYGH
ncbi:MAG: phytanoyl-CoA dioxygenase [Verrucomicrobia bacterium]|nr:phytanoyl-CoA dioxygenase [Verrucomicrobiota bacterium]